MLFRAGRMFVVAGCIVLGLVAHAAAADIPYPVKGAPPLADAPASWAGFYLGAQVGYGTDNVRWRNLGTSTTFSPLDSVTHDRGGGVIGGGQVGYNFQVNRIVFGIEGSMSAADFDRSFASPYFPATDTWSSKLTWLGTVTGRIGYGFDSWMPYVKGGFAAGNHRHDHSEHCARRDVARLVGPLRMDSRWRRRVQTHAPSHARPRVHAYDLGRTNDISGVRAVERQRATVRRAQQQHHGAINYLFGGR
jgi:opacity protein-like surface antigen